MYEDEETMVEENFDDEADDTLEEEVEEEDESEEEDLDSIPDEEEQNEEPPAQEQPSEPGWIKQRVNKAVQKAVAETEARMQAMFEQQMAPIRAKMMEDEAQELVRTRKVTDIETARELVRLRQGQPAQQAAEPQQQVQRNETPQDDPVTTTRINMLAHQADTIKNETGMDVVDVFLNDDDIQEAVKNGEMDFYDVARMMEQQSNRRPPSPMRSPNGASGVAHNAITTMSDEQFRRMEKRIAEGARYTLR